MTDKTLPLATLPAHEDIPGGVPGFYRYSRANPRLPDLLGYGSGVGTIDGEDFCLILSLEAGEYVHVMRLKLAERVQGERVVHFHVP